MDKILKLVMRLYKLQPQSSEDGMMNSEGEDLAAAGDDEDSMVRQVVVGICAMEKKSLSKPMREILTRLEEFEYLKTAIFPENVILNVSGLFIQSEVASIYPRRCGITQPMKGVCPTLHISTQDPVEDWPLCDCLVAFHSTGFPIEKAIEYTKLRKPYIINNLEMQFDIQDRRSVYAILEKEGIEIPRYAILDRESDDPESM